MDFGKKKNRRARLLNHHHHNVSDPADPNCSLLIQALAGLWILEADILVSISVVTTCCHVFLPSTPARMRRSLRQTGILLALLLNSSRLLLILGSGISASNAKGCKWQLLAARCSKRVTQSLPPTRGNGSSAADWGGGVLLIQPAPSSCCTWLLGWAWESAPLPATGFNNGGSCMPKDTQIPVTMASGARLA